uniref:Uncharacterized protein n=1 Tax=Triticum urartu TaxID=4572 RepID=A0A8R7UJ32_TRIUA
MFIAAIVICLTIFLFFAFKHLHLRCPCGSIRRQGIIISIIIRVVLFLPFPPLSDVTTAIFNIAPFTAILFCFIAARGGGQVYRPPGFIAVALFAAIPGDMGGFHDRPRERETKREKRKAKEERQNEVDGEFCEHQLL